MYETSEWIEMNENDDIDLRIANILKRDALKVLKVFSLQKPGWPVNERDIGCLLAVVLFAISKAKLERGKVNVDEIFRWGKMLLPLIVEEVMVTPAFKAAGGE